MGAIDANARVIETVQTWSYLDEGDRRFTPQLMTQTFGRTFSVTKEPPCATSG